ncbi:MHYT domain-containing protein [Herbaspirillum sp. GCM10030257]|uniref:MHYT domain-containing protein n=1 Tax=Herbaspirillum sp. GCM10030257 TaxID=3273393 RepID=UPI00360904AD
MLTGYYDTPLVLVSILVAIFASYTALSMAGRVTTSHGTAERLWIGGGALAMGIGIWAMHFIGMLAFRLPIPVGYDFWITFLSLLLPVVVSGMALHQVSRPELPVQRLIAGAVLMGIGINAMHYTGMFAMRMAPGIRYDPLLFAASVIIAVVASAAALWIAFRLRGNVPQVWLPRAGASVIMGVAIVGMHYTGMAAAGFPENSICMAAGNGFDQDELALMVILASFGVLTVALLTSVFDARLESRSQVLAASQAIAEERQILLLRERAARTQAESMSALKDEFLATLSHELRTPLNAILGWAQILGGGARDEATLVKGLETIERNARAQAQLIEDLLDMSQIISGKVRLDVRPIDPANFIEAALETVRPAAMAKNIRLETTLDPQAGQIAGDPNRLQQIMWNLLSNAVKFTPNGGHIHVSLNRSAAGIAIRVVDSGIGIQPEFLPYVFDRFRQADASTTRRYSGLGLGLSIVKQLVELQGGTVTVASRGDGNGAAFTLDFPLLNPNAAVARHQMVPGAYRPTIDSDFTRTYLSGIKVLVVDDEVDALDLMEWILRECGATICRVSNAIEALSLVERERPDIVVSDIGMPDVDGFELIRRIRALGEVCGGTVPALALTAFTRAEDHQRALQAGFNLYMTKPVEPSTFAANIAKMAGSRATVK